MTDVLPEMKQALKGGPFLQKVLKEPSPPFYLQWLLALEMTSAVKISSTETRMSFRFPVQREYLNPSDFLHGAAQTLFFDVCTTFLLGPLAREPNFWTTYGVSRSLNMVYLRPAVEGEILTLECETVNVGKRLALLKGLIRNADGAIVSTCEHQLYNVDADRTKM